MFSKIVSFAVKKKMFVVLATLLLLAGGYILHAYPADRCRS